ncbi:MAG: HAMP domain-containing histidine kinase [Bacteroidetes bacterium]|nr:HAMP domain-containing histidine kinase [Bacteroidota bacterium]
MVDFIYKLPDELKKDFRLTTDKKNKSHIRIAIIAGLLLYSLFGFLDKALVPDMNMVHKFWFIRYALLLPTAVFVFAATYSNSLYRWIQPLLGLTVIVAGLGINYMILIAPSPISENYYAGLILIFIYGYSFLRINFIWATFSGWFIVLAYELSAVFILDVPTNVLINNNFFFISANILGMFSNLSFENQSRKEFHTAYQLDVSNKEIKQNNLHLEERVKERTYELEKINRKLSDEINEKAQIQIKLVKAKERAENANNLKSEFLAQMSHEIRSPINTILNFTSLVKDLTESNCNEELKLSFSGIDSASRRIVRTIDLILNTSELQLGTYEISNREINLYNILESLHHEYFKYAESKGIELKLNLINNKAKVYSDDYAINQIFANLIDNAIKYTENGFVEIILTNNSHENYSVIIKDTGKGISKKYLPHIFEQFTQEEKGYTRKYEGSGLGLALVKRYCEIIDAKILVESTEGTGTSFEILINKNLDPNINFKKDLYIIPEKKL